MISGQQRSGDILLIASHAPDLAGMRPWLGDRLDGVIRNLRLRAKIVGMGMPVAAAATARGILAVQPRAVVMLGTCGVYPNLSQYRPLDVVLANKISLLDHAVLSRRSAFPDPMQTSIDGAPVMCAALQTCHPRAFPAHVASPLASTTEDSLAGSVHGATGCEAENLEVFGVAAAARAADVPFVAVLGVTNIVGSTGRQDWAQFQRDAVASAGSAVAAWMHNGAQGLPHD